jgi:hypothetical protein
MRRQLLPYLPSCGIMRTARTAMVHLTESAGVSHDVLRRVMHPRWMAWLLHEPNVVPLVHAMLGITAPSGAWASQLPPPAITTASDLPAPLPQVTHLQQALSSAIERADLARYETALAGIAGDDARKLACARHLSASSTGAMAFAGALPSLDEAFTMQQHHFREACRRMVGIERPHTPGTLCSKCPEENTPQHARRCARTGSLSTRHHAVRNAWASGLKRMGLLGVRTEQSAPFVGGDEPEMAMDITIEGGQGFAAAAALSSGLGVLLDVKVTDPTGTTVLPRAAKQRAYAAEQCARRNHQHYDAHYDHSRYVLIPLAVEVFGGACAELHTFIDALASFKAAQCGGTWRKSSIVDWWRRRLSVAVQSATSAAVDWSLRRSRPSGTYIAYTTVSLLRVPAAVAAAPMHDAHSIA